MATDPSRSYDVSDPLGQGGYGSVFSGEFKGRKVAVKRVEVYNLHNDNEEKALEQLDHPNIVKLFYSEKGNNYKFFYLELCAASLDQVFLPPDNPKKYKGPPLPRYIDVCRQLASGLEHIHSKKLIHRDIKPQNILISVPSTGRDDEITIKWADFGLSKSVNERGTCSMSDVRGTKNWFAPELLKLLLDGRETIEARGSVKSDVFSLGLVFGYLFLDGKHLYGSNEFQIKENIIKKQMPMDVQEKLKECCGDEILGLMLKDDPNERITSTNIVLGLKLMEDKLSSKVRELLEKSSPDLKERIKHFSRLGFDVNAKDEYEDNDGCSAFDYLQNKDKKEMKILIERDALLGEGGFAAVFKGKFGGREVAVKRIELHKVDEREEDAMLKLEHPNIIKLLHCEKDNHFMYYALELCVASLDQLFLESDDPQKYEGPTPRQIVVFYQLAKGLAYIHSKKLIHRDIKPSNILIMKSPGKYQEIIIKWSDFGLAKSVNEKGLHSWSGVRGTRTWWAPEVLRKLINGERAEQEEFWGTVQSDVFVLGLVFGYLFLKGEHLYGSSETEIHKNISERNPVNMQNINGELRKYYEDDLLRKMLEQDPQKRITSKQVVEKLESINNKLIKKEEELRQLCKRGSSSGLIEKIKDLIQLGIDVNAKDNDGSNALHFLCENNSNSNLIDVIRLLIQLGIDVNAKDNDGSNALHYLCGNDSNSNLIDAIRLLIQLGIDVNAKNNDGSNALHFLCENNSNSNLIDAIRLLIQLGIDVNVKDDDGQNALHYLCENNSNSNLIDVIRLLIQLGIDVNAKDNDGSNALHYLCCNHSNSKLIDAIQLLILEGIDVNAKDNDGSNALHYLCRKNSNSNLIDAIRLFIQLGIPVVSDGHDARSILRRNYRINNKDKILKLLDEAALV
ncbi:hypothetical protein OUZ56_020390 [Daphnia magna]|uniref:Protein kinase domain-containing protein n=1 Tax=Daphnia magna TaxID=35525 RepID=A0ABQ9ZED0_9CRUS|nr:hypothetical protein OUZ56_020390 [Daphnia magna]